MNQPSRCFQTHLCLWLASLLMAGWQGLGAQPVDFQTPQAPGVSRYSTLWENSPFTREIVEKNQSTPQEYFLSAMAVANGRQLISVTNRRTNESQMLDETGDESSGKILSIHPADDLLNVSAEVEIGGQRMTLKYDQQSLTTAPENPAAAPNAAPNGQPITTGSSSQPPGVASVASSTTTAAANQNPKRVNRRVIRASTTPVDATPPSAPPAVPVQ